MTAVPLIISGNGLSVIVLWPLHCLCIIVFDQHSWDVNHNNITWCETCCLDNSKFPRIHNNYLCITKGITFYMSLGVRIHLCVRTCSHSSQNGATGLGYRIIYCLWTTCCPICAHHNTHVLYYMYVMIGFSTSGYTAMHFGAIWGQLECVKVLVSLGADYHLTTRHKETVQDLASRYGNTKCVTYINCAGTGTIYPMSYAQPLSRCCAVNRLQGWILYKYNY